MIAAILTLLALVLPLAAVAQVLHILRRTPPAPPSPSPSTPSVEPAIRVRVWRVYRDGRLIYQTTSHDSGAPLRRGTP